MNLFNKNLIKIFIPKNKYKFHFLNNFIYFFYKTPTKIKFQWKLKFSVPQIPLICNHFNELYFPHTLSNSFLFQRFKNKNLNPKSELKASNPEDHNMILYRRGLMNDCWIDFKPRFFFFEVSKKVSN